MLTKKLPVLPSARDLETCVTQLKVLADPTRLSVIRLLLAGPAHVNSLAEQLNVEQSLLSHHLKVPRRRSGRFEPPGQAGRLPRGGGRREVVQRGGVDRSGMLQALVRRGAEARAEALSWLSGGVKESAPERI
jgi:DNA-binding transcriptional ArsR family regulator